MKTETLKRQREGLKITGDDILITFISLTPDLLVHAEVTNNDKVHNVYYHNDLWRCTCEDYQYRGVNRDEGSFLCKHIYAVINSLKEVGEEVGRTQRSIQNRLSILRRKGDGNL